MDFSPLTNLLEKTLRKAGITQQVFSAMQIERFEKSVSELMGEAAAKKVKGLNIKNKILWVACLQPDLAQELRLREREILLKLNEGLKVSRVIKIRYLM